MVSFLIVLLICRINGYTKDCSNSCYSSDPAICTPAETCTITCNSGSCDDAVVNANFATDVTIDCNNNDCDRMIINCQTATGICRLECTSSSSGTCSEAKMYCGDNKCELDCRANHEEDGGACDDMIVDCGKSDCSMYCYEADSAGSCKRVILNTTVASSWLCTGNECNQIPNVPAPFTSNPTPQPTIIPTSQPTFQPTMNPTLNPTFNPTPNPTAQPTVQPTPMPTVIPTIIPTKSPITSTPTKTPSSQTVPTSPTAPTAPTSPTSPTTAIPTGGGHAEVTETIINSKQDDESEDTNTISGNKDLDDWVFVVAGCSGVLCLCLVFVICIRLFKKKRDAQEAKIERIQSEPQVTRVSQYGRGSESAYNSYNKGEGVNHNKYDTENMAVFDQNEPVVHVQDALLNNTTVPSHMMTIPNGDNDNTSSDDTPHVEMNQLNGEGNYDATNDDFDMVVNTAGGPMDNEFDNGIDNIANVVNNNDDDDDDDDDDVMDNIAATAVTSGAINKDENDDDYDAFVNNNDDNDIINDIDNAMSMKTAGSYNNNNDNDNDNDIIDNINITAGSQNILQQDDQFVNDINNISLTAAGNDNNIWNDYINKFGEEPKYASQLQQFSKSNAKYKNLSYKEATALINNNNGNDDGGNDPDIGDDDILDEMDTIQ